METSAAAASAGGFFPSFLLLAFGTLVAAVLGAAHRLGLFYQLMHKVLRARGLGEVGDKRCFSRSSTVQVWKASSD